MSDQGNLAGDGGNQTAEVRMVSLYLNDVMWKYVAVDLSIVGYSHTSAIIPAHITTRARAYYHKKHRVTFQQFAEEVEFRRFNIPIAEGLKDIRYYGVNKFLKVNKHHTITFDLPDDPEDKIWTS